MLPFLALVAILSAAQVQCSLTATPRNLHGLVARHFVDRNAFPAISRRATTPGPWEGEPKVAESHNTGVSAMLLVVTQENEVLLGDRAQNNPLLRKNGIPAQIALMNLTTGKLRALNIDSNLICAGGSWLANGSLVLAGGNTATQPYSFANGHQLYRVFTPCPAGRDCDVVENINTMKLQSRRWYGTTVRLQDGSVVVIGGEIRGATRNNVTWDNPTFEYLPRKNNGKDVYSPFLHEALAANTFAHSFLLPDGRLFMASNQLVQIYDWINNKEYRLPNMPNKVRVTYPFSGSSALLPLAPAKNYAPEVLICGGSVFNETLESKYWKPSIPASRQCTRFLLTEEGIANAFAKGWPTELMPSGRTMSELIITPTGQLVVTGGAQTGFAAACRFGAADGTSASCADNPAYTPLLYEPQKAQGKRISEIGAQSNIARMYHSSATLLPDGTILSAGSNPNGQVNLVGKYITEYRSDILTPPYATRPRPIITESPKRADYNASILLKLSLTDRNVTSDRVQVALMDLGVHTHGFAPDQRLVWLNFVLGTDRKSLRATLPPLPTIYPPGPAWLFVNVDGVPSVGKMIYVGKTGSIPLSY